MLANYPIQGFFPHFHRMTLGGRARRTANHWVALIVPRAQVERAIRSTVRSIMNTQTEQHTFRGVICLHCKAAIPVPAVVGHTGDDLNDGAGFPQRNSQVFNLRCPVCHKEKPYWTKEIVNFEGTPEMTIYSSRPVSAQPFLQNEVAKAAKA